MSIYLYIQEKRLSLQYNEQQKTNDMNNQSQIIDTTIQEALQFTQDLIKKSLSVGVKEPKEFYLIAVAVSEAFSMDIETATMILELSIKK